MKTIKLFTKKNKADVKANVQTLDRKQLSKVIGGLDKGDKSDGLSAETKTDQNSVRALDGNPSI